MALCMHCFVAGKVQGVWFRASTQTKAQELKLKGWVRNLPDGRVEVLACGEEQLLESLYQWLQHGPELAKVEEFSRDFVKWQEFSEFKVK